MTRKRTPHSGPFRSQAERDFSNTVDRAMSAAKPKTNRTARILIPVAAGGATLAAGAYLYHRSQKGKKAVTKNLINPFEEVVVYGKAYPVVDTTMGVRQIRALVPTGSHVGHANALVHVRGPRSGGHATKLERYSGPKSGGKVHGVLRATGGHGGKKAGLDRFSGPHSGGKQAGVERFRGPHAGGKKPGLERYSKAYGGTTGFWSQSNTVGRGLEQIARQPKPKTKPTGNWKPALKRRLNEGPEVNKAIPRWMLGQNPSGTVGRSLEMVARAPKLTRVPKAPKTAQAFSDVRNAARAGRGNSNIPSGARRGLNLGVS